MLEVLLILKKKLLILQNKLKMHRNRLLLKFYRDNLKMGEKFKILLKIFKLSCFLKEFMIKLQPISATWSTKYTQNFHIFWSRWITES